MTARFGIAALRSLVTGSLVAGLMVAGCAPAASDGNPKADAATTATGGNTSTGGATGPTGTGGGLVGSGGIPGASGGSGSGGSDPTGSGGTTGTGGTGPSASGGTSTGGAASGGQGGNVVGTGGSGQTGGRTGSGGSSASSGGNSGTGGGAGGQGGTTSNPFICSQIIGLTLTSEWYLAGSFESGVDATRWQLKFAQSAYVDQWANASSSFWNTQVMSPCARNATVPDRVILVVLSWTIMAQSAWETAVGGAVNTIKAKYPAVRRIELMTIVRGPQNTSCSNPNDYAENTHIPIALDNALAKIAANQPQLVRVAPKFEVSACSDYRLDGTRLGPHLTAAGNIKMAGIISAHYAKDP